MQLFITSFNVGRRLDGILRPRFPPCSSVRIAAAQFIKTEYQLNYFSLFFGSVRIRAKKIWHMMMVFIRGALRRHLASWSHAITYHWFYHHNSLIKLNFVQFPWLKSRHPIQKEMQSHAITFFGSFGQPATTESVVFSSRSHKVVISNCTDSLKHQMFFATTRSANYWVIIMSIVFTNRRVRAPNEYNRQ